MTGTALDHVLAFLIPIFLKGAGGDHAAARRATIQMLESYRPATDRDLFLAAEVIAFSFATLDNLSRSMADPDLSINTCLRLRSNATALSRAAERNRNILERSQQANVQPDRPPRQPLEIPQSIQKLDDALLEAAPTLAETPANAGPTMSRQQRRFLTRKAEQARVAQEREARKAARLAPRIIATA